MKKLLLTTGLASAVLFSANAMAEVKVGAVLEWNIGSSETAATGTKDSGPTAIGFSTELDISSTKTLSNGMILSLHAEMMDNTAGFTDVGFNLTSGNVRFHIGQDDLAIGDSDVVPKVGEAFDSSLLNGITYSASKGTTHANATIGGVYTTPVGSFQVGYQPQGGSGLGAHWGGLDTVASGGSSYEVGFFGDLGVKGLNTKLVRVVDQPANDTAANEDITSLQYGAAYNFGKVSVGAHRIDYDGSAVTADDETHTGIGVTFAASDQLSFGVEMTKMEKDGTASDEDGLSVGVGYDLGGLVITAQYLEIENAGGVTGKDAEAFLIITVAAF